MAKLQKNSFEFELEKFQYQSLTYERVKTVGAIFIKGYAKPTPRDNTVVPHCYKTGIFTNSYQIHNTDRGHLIALELGGPEQSENLVPMWGKFNRHGKWKILETTLKLKTALAGKVELRIDCLYGGSDPRVPSAFKITWKTQNSLASSSQIDHPVPKPQKIQNYGQLKKLLEEANKNGLKSFDIEEEDVRGLRGRKFVFPPLEKRPYAALDFLCLTKALSIKSHFRANEPFSKEQRELILLMNRLNNDGWLKSDDPEDYAYTDLEYLDASGNHAGLLMIGGGQQAPEVDHVIPSSLGGCNAFSNAMVLSSGFNKSKSASISWTHMEKLVKTRRIQPKRKAKHTLTEKEYKEKTYKHHLQQVKVAKKRKIEKLARRRAYLLKKYGK